MHCIFWPFIHKFVNFYEKAIFMGELSVGQIVRWVNWPWANFPKSNCPLGELYVVELSVGWIVRRRIVRGGIVRPRLPTCSGIESPNQLWAIGYYLSVFPNPVPINLTAPERIGFFFINFRTLRIFLGQQTIYLSLCIFTFYLWIIDFTRNNSWYYYCRYKPMYYRSIKVTTNID